MILSSCSRENAPPTKLSRPLIPLPSDRIDVREPVLSPDGKGQTFNPVATIDNGSGRVFFHGDVNSRPFPIESVWEVDAGQRDQQIGQGYRMNVEIIQVSEWQHPSFEILATGEEVDYQQVYSRHHLFDSEGRELSPERAVSLFPQAGGSALFPVSRSGSWYQHSFKRQVALWFRIEDADGIPMDGGHIKALGAIDQRTDFPIPGGGLFGMGRGEHRMTVATPFWHDGGLDFVIDQLHTPESSHQDFDLVEGEVYEMGGFHVQVLLFRTGTWKSRSLNEQESELAEASSFAQAVEKESDQGSTLMAVTDGGPTGREWMMGVVGMDGKTMWAVRRNGPFLFQEFNNPPRQRDRVEPSRLRITRGPDRDRIIVSVNAVSGTTPENKDPANLFDQRVPFFYAKNLSEAMRAISELVAIEWEPPFPKFPRKPEGFPLALHDVTVHEIAAEIAKCLDTEGLGFELDQESWQWQFPYLAPPSVTGAQTENPNP